MNEKKSQYHPNLLHKKGNKIINLLLAVLLLQGEDFVLLQIIK